MDKHRIQAALTEIEETRERLIVIVNMKMDELRNKVENGEAPGERGTGECVYPLSMTPEFFKGKKPSAVFFGSERVSVTKWRTVYALILRRCNADAACHERLMGLRNRIHGRVRTILSDKPDGMDRPTEVSAGLYAEADFDTGALIRMLTTGILDPAGYDYSGIFIAVQL